MNNKKFQASLCGCWHWHWDIIYLCFILFPFHQFCYCFNLMTGEQYWDPQCLDNIRKFFEFKYKSLFNEAVFSQYTSNYFIITLFDVLLLSKIKSYILCMLGPLLIFVVWDIFFQIHGRPFIFLFALLLLFLTPFF